MTRPSTPADVLAAAAELCATLDALWEQERRFLVELSAALSASAVVAEQAMRERQSRDWAQLDAWWFHAATTPTRRGLE